VANLRVSNDLALYVSRPNVYTVAYEASLGHSHKAKFMERVILGVCFGCSNNERECVSVSLLAGHGEKIVFLFAGLSWTESLWQGAYPRSSCNRQWFKKSTFIFSRNSHTGLSELTMQSPTLISRVAGHPLRARFHLSGNRCRLNRSMQHHRISRSVNTSP
jgi:hypothetical protein